MKRLSGESGGDFMGLNALGFRPYSHRESSRASFPQPPPLAV